jgi:hypothetical protein
MRTPFFISCFGLLLCSTPAGAQYTDVFGDGANTQRNAQGYSQGFAQRNTQVYARPNTQGYYQNNGFSNQRFPSSNFGSYPSQGFVSQPARPAYPSMGNQGFPQAGGQNGNLLKMFLGGGQPQQAPMVQQQSAAQSNPFTAQNLLKAFMGGTPSTGTDGNASNYNSGAVGNAQSNLQTARDQAAQAESACSRASYGEKSYRSSAASEAQDHANAARAAADRATSAAYGQSSSANDYAAQARNAADRAQAAADRAQYNASTGN